MRVRPAMNPLVKYDDAPPLKRQRGYGVRTIDAKRLTKRDIEAHRLEYPETDHDKPTSRAECIGGVRPCPFASCRYNLILDVSPRTGTIKLNFASRDVDELPETCALDVAERGGMTLYEVGKLLNVTRERVRQIEAKAFTRLKRMGCAWLLETFLEKEPRVTNPHALGALERDEP